MAEYKQEPGILDIRVKKGNEISILLTFSINLTGYTFSAYFSEGIITVEIVDLATGKINLRMQESLTESLTNRLYPWQLDLTTGGVTRTFLQGNIIIE